MLRKSRRSGRPASAKEDLLKLKIDGLVKEQLNGFCKCNTAQPPQGIVD